MSTITWVRRSGTTFGTLGLQFQEPKSLSGRGIPGEHMLTGAYATYVPCNMRGTDVVSSPSSARHPDWESLHRSNLRRRKPMFLQQCCILTRQCMWRVPGSQLPDMGRMDCKLSFRRIHFVRALENRFALCLTLISSDSRTQSQPQLRFHLGHISISHWSVGFGGRRAME